jgi:predicted P-loop ATPase
VDKYDVFDTFLYRWLIGAVAKAYTGAQNRMLIIDAAQGLGKSQFVRWLASPLPDLHVEGPINPDSKDDLIRLMQGWIWEVAEMGSTTRRADQDALKHFLTIQQVTVRAPYGRYDMVKPALASFIGTINRNGGVLNDPTGSRRFMTSHITAIDWSYNTRLDANQVWAQAYKLYLDGVAWDLTPGEAAFAAQINDDYEVEDPLIDLINTNFEIDPDQVEWSRPTVDILETLHGEGWRLSSPRGEAVALAAAAGRLGLSSAVIKTQAGKRVRGYRGIK